MIRKVQASAYGTTSTPFTTPAVATAFGVGHLLVVMFGGGKGAKLESVTGGGVTTWTKAVRAENTESAEGKEVHVDIYYGFVTSAAKTTVTCTFSAAPNAADTLVVAEYSGVKAFLATGTAQNKNATERTGVASAAEDGTLAVGMVRTHGLEVKAGPGNRWSSIPVGSAHASTGAGYVIANHTIGPLESYWTGETDWWAGAIALFTATEPPSATYNPPAEAGKVAYRRDVKGTFDTEAQATNSVAINRNFARLLAYTPGFDGKAGTTGQNRTAWYKRAEAYKSALAIYVGETADRAGLKPETEHPEYIVRATTNHAEKLYITPGTEYLADVTNAGWRALFVQRCEEDYLAGEYSSIFVDQVILKLGEPLNGSGVAKKPYSEGAAAEITQAQWEAGLVALITELREAIPSHPITTHLTWSGTEAVPGLPNTNANIQTLVEKSQTVERALGAFGLSGGTTATKTLWGFFQYAEELHELGVGVLITGSGEQIKTMEYQLATYFLLSEGKDVISGAGGNRITAAEGWKGTIPSGFWPGFEVDLGKPTEALWQVIQAYEADGRGLWKRRFAKGLVYLLEPGSPERKVQLPPGRWATADGQEVTELTLAAATFSGEELSSEPAAFVLQGLPSEEEEDGGILYQMLPSVFVKDEETGYFGKDLCEALEAMFQNMHKIVMDSPENVHPILGTPYAGLPRHCGWSAITDPRVAPDEWLPWTAKLWGVTLTGNTSAEQKREQIEELPPQKRGGVPAMIKAARETLTGTKTVHVFEQVEGESYHMLVTTLPSETPSEAATKAALLTQKPAGLELTYVVGVTWGDATKQWRQVGAGVTWANVKTGDV